MDGLGGVGFEQIQQGQAVRHHQSRYRQIRFGMRHVHHRQGHSQLEQVEFRLELHPGRHALFRRYELRGRQCGTQLRFRPPQPVRRTDRRPAGHRDLSGCEGHAGHHDEMESEAFQRDQRLRGQDAGHDRRTIQGDRAGGHPHRVRERQQGRREDDHHLDPDHVRPRGQQEVGYVLRRVSRARRGHHGTFHLQIRRVRGMVFRQ